jgi:hypothetical protein
MSAIFQGDTANDAVNTLNGAALETTSIDLSPSNTTRQDDLAAAYNVPNVSTAFPDAEAAAKDPSNTNSPVVAEPATQD